MTRGRRRLGALAILACGALAGSYALLHGPAPAEPEPSGGAMRVLRDGAEAEVSGPLSLDLAAALQTVLARPDPPRTIQLDSPGGSVGGAARIAGLLRDANVDTAVTDRCLSACVAVFMAGRRRWVGPFALIGLEPGDERLALYRSAGVPGEILREVSATGPGQAWFPPAADLLRTGMATGEAAADQFALGGFGPAPTPASIRARLLSVPLYFAAASVDPDAFDADLDVWIETVLHGRPGTDAFDRTRATLSHAFQRALLGAPDALLLQHASLFVDELDWMERHRTKLCPAWAEAQGGLPGPTDEALVDRRHSVMLAVLTAPREGSTAAPEGAPAPAADCASLRQAWTEAGSPAAIRALLHPPRGN